MFLLPVRGSRSQWYKNAVKSKKIKISTGKLSLDLSANPITESQRIATVADKFRKKHGASNVKKYYTVFDAAVELTLP